MYIKLVPEISVQINQTVNELFLLTDRLDIKQLIVKQRSGSAQTMCWGLRLDSITPDFKISFCEN